ncbi:MAG: hypothetical protein ACKOBG_03270 [Actinomycetota bacterium]
MSRSRFAALVVVVALAAFAVPAAAGPSSKSITIDSCSVSPTVTWSGYSTGSVQVEFHRFSGGRKVQAVKSLPVNVSPKASSGTLLVPGPAAVTGDGWQLHDVYLFKDANAKGSMTTGHFHCNLVASGLTVVFLGEEFYDNNIGQFVFAPLGTAGSVNSVSVCETAVPANCVVFPSGTQLNASGSITMAASGTLTFGIPGDACPLFAYASAVTAQAAFSYTATPVEYGIGPTVTTNSYGNGDTLYLVHITRCG